MGAAHALQTETVFTFFLFWSTLNFAWFIKQGCPKHLYSAILLVAIAALTRPVGFYWGYSLPAIVLLGAFFQNKTQTFSKKFGDYCLSMSIPCNGNNPFSISKALSDFIIFDLKKSKPKIIAKAGLKSLIMLAVSTGTGLFREA